MNSNKIFNNQFKKLKEKQSNIKFDKISNYFLQNLFSILQNKRKLQIIKYNIVIQNILNITINDYKNYFEVFTPIEIEIKPIKNKFGKFINNEGEESYYHIYFNDNKNETKINYISKENSVSKIKIIIDYQVQSFKRLFSYCKCIESIIFKKFNRNNITDMKEMFSNCSFLEKIDFLNFNTQNVIDMSGMFSFCTAIKELNLSKFNFSNVTDLSGMFIGCSSLKELNIPFFNNNELINVNGMFSGCAIDFKKKIRQKYKFVNNKAFDYLYIYQ